MIIFFTFIFYLGTYASGLERGGGIDNMMLAGRSIPLFIAVFTMSATWVGGGYINGTAENTYSQDYGLVWVQAPWGYALSLIVGGLIFARKMRRLEFKTMLDPLTQKFGQKMSAVLFVPALTGEVFWTSAILTALGITFGTILGMDTQFAIIISAVIAIAYTAIGGLWAVAITDVFQMIILILGLVIVVPVALSHLGEPSEVWQVYVDQKGAAASFLPSKEALGAYYWVWWDYALLLILGGIPWQVYFQRVLSAKNEDVAVRLSVFAGIVCLIAAIPAVMIGVIGSAADWTALGLPEPANAASVLPHVIRYLTNPVVATIGLGAIAAAVMSSVDSSILSVSSMFSWNIYRPLFKPDVSSENLIKIIKRSIWIVGITATLLALKIESVYQLWFLCSDFVYCLLFPALFCAMFDKKANVYGAIAGFTVAFILRFGGGETTLGIPNFIPYPGTIGDEVVFPFRTFAMISGLLSIFIVSRLTQGLLPGRALVRMKKSD
jgi:high affinity choline transporter 7